MQHWLIVTSPANFRLDRDDLKFCAQGLPLRFRKQVQKMAAGDRVVYYIMKLQKFGATATITGEYYEDSSKLWMDDDEMWPARCPSKPDLVLNDDELVDAKKLVPDLSFILKKDSWGSYLQGSIKMIPQEDFRLIESEMKKIVSERSSDIKPTAESNTKPVSEDGYEREVLQLPLQSSSLHDRLGEMLEQIGSWMDYNTQTRHRITPDHAYQLDVAWLTGKNPEVAIEIQISGNITEAKDRLAQARKFNYRKVIIVLRQQDLLRMNLLMRHEPDLRSWMEAWSIGSIYKMYVAGEKFFKYYRKMIEATYKDKRELELVG
ncbi:MAG: EVE domain-containing protein [Syntrophobacteraceae bacterium]